MSLNREDESERQLANQMKENSQKWDDDMDRWVQFCSKVNEVINQNKLPIRTLILEGEIKISGFKVSKKHVSHLLIGNAKDSLLKAAFIIRLRFGVF